MRLYSGKVGTIASRHRPDSHRGRRHRDRNPRNEVRLDIESVLNSYLKTEKEAADKAKDLMQSRGLRQGEFARMKKLAAEQKGIKVGDETIDYLLDQILEILMHSANVDEISREDVELRRKMAPDAQAAHGRRRRARARSARASSSTWKRAPARGKSNTRASWKTSGAAKGLDSAY